MSATIELPILISLGSLLFVILNFAYQRFKVNADMQSDIRELKTQVKEVCKRDYIDDIQDILQRVKALEVKNEIVWDAISKTVVDILHHPNRIERDTLLEKFRDKTITMEELEKLNDMLHCDLIDEKGRDEALAATLLIARIKQIMYDNGKLQILINNPKNVYKKCHLK